MTISTLHFIISIYILYSLYQRNVIEQEATDKETIWTGKLSFSMKNEAKMCAAFFNFSLANLFSLIFALSCPVRLVQFVNVCVWWWCSTTKHKRHIVYSIIAASYVLAEERIKMRMKCEHLCTLHIWRNVYGDREGARGRATHFAGYFDCIWST